MAELVPEHGLSFFATQSRRPFLFISKELETVGVLPLIDKGRITTQNRGKGGFDSSPPFRIAWAMKNGVPCAFITLLS